MTGGAGRWGYVALVLVAPGIVASALSLAAFMTLDGEVVNVEAMGAVNACRWADGDGLYRDWTRFPHAITPYVPGVYAIPALATRVLELSPRATLRYGRAVSLISFGLLLILVFRWSRSRGADRGAALAVVGVLVGADLMTQFAAAFRPDALSLLCEAAALMALQQSEERSTRPWAAAVLMLCAGAVKQTALIAVVAGAAWLVSRGRARRAAWLVAVVGATAGAATVAAQLITGGEFWRNVVTSNVLPGSWAHLRQVLRASVPAAPFVLAGGGALAGAATRRDLGPFSWLLVLGTAWGVGGSMRAGAWVNYAFEASLAGSLALGVLLARRVLGGRLLLLGAAALFGVVGLQVVPLRAAALAAGSGGEYERLAALVDGSELLTDDAYLALVAGRLERATDLFHVSGLIAKGELSGAEGVRLIEDQRFDVAVVRSMGVTVPGVPWFPPAWDAALARRYHVTAVLPTGHRAWRPTGPAGPPAPAGR